ncbi:MAG: hypothetical protein KAT85_05800 [candidate division Zixibacteria bacterium]|nr:hypothetical protein [candidate division Zixibacteria bacterium]
MLQILLTWPVLTFSFALFFCLRFRTEIGNAIERFKGFRFRDTAADFEPQSAPPAVSRDHEPMTEEEILEAADELLKAGDPQQTDIAGWMKQVAEERQFWEFMYLDFFLIPVTKQTLNWLYSTNGASTQEITHYFDLWKILPDQGTAILGALRHHSLLTVDSEGKKMIVSLKGIQYLKHIHALPEPPVHQ